MIESHIVMNVVERTQHAMTGCGLPDRVPIHAWLGLSFIRSRVPRRYRMIDLFQMWIDDPVGTLVKYQADLGLDPLMTTYSQHIGEHEVWSRMLFRHDDMAYAHWDEYISELDRTSTSRTIQHRIYTPAGEGRYSYRLEGFSSWPLEYLIKEQKDLDLLHYRPDPLHLNLDRFQAMIDKVGNRAWWLHHAPGPWEEAVNLRGLVALSADIYEQPEFVHRLMRLVTDYLKKLYRRLSDAPIQAISMNETWVGVGLSPETYREFIQPYDAECVAAAHEAGLLVSYHNCGRGASILEDMIDTKADALETITSLRNMGDFELADVKKRIGQKVCLFGGFDERLLTTNEPHQVRDEVKRCIDAAAEGGRYILRPGGQIFYADPRNIEIMCQTAHDYGRYSS
jgi:uroporphyrinogen decarboxylase